MREGRSVRPKGLEWPRQLVELAPMGSAGSLSVPGPETSRLLQSAKSRQWSLNFCPMQRKRRPLSPPQTIGGEFRSRPAGEFFFFSDKKTTLNVMMMIGPSHALSFPIVILPSSSSLHRLHLSYHQHPASVLSLFFGAGRSRMMGAGLWK